jgi:arginyl-tRNA--protein-N-Asp/Glu arginylyltransferase
MRQRAEHAVEEAGRRRMNLFFSTELAPCPYLEGRRERRLVTLLDGGSGVGLHDRLLLAGFRRSQNFAYRPACPGCQACVPVRIPVAGFRLTRGWRRILKHNADLEARERRAVATREQFELFARYLSGRHAESGMSEMSWGDYRAMVQDSPIETVLIEWRRPDGSLIAASLTDRGASGLSGVYKFFDPAEAARSLGSLIILWHVERAREQGLPYVYLGYWIAGSPKMAYKARFGPLEHLTPAGWQPLFLPAAGTPDECGEA